MEKHHNLHLIYKNNFMKKTTLLLFLIIITFRLAFAQIFKEKELKTEIKEVTVFLSGAQLFETGNATIPKGNTLLKVKGLSPFVDEKSIQVKADADFTILSVTHKLNYLNELKKDEKLDSLKNAIDKITASITKDNSRLEVLKEKQSLLNENKNFGGQNSGATIAALKQAMEFYESEISKIKDEEIRTRRSIDLLGKEQSKIEKQMKELQSHSSLPSSEIEIRVSAETQLASNINITYLVANAGWFPKYDIRVENVKSPLELTYKAEVFQSTGVDWKNVKLRFSNGDPNKSGVMPELETWNLNYARNTAFESLYKSQRDAIRNVKGRVVDDNGEPLPGVNVLIKGTTIGTVTDAGGNYSLTLPNGASQLVFAFIGMMTNEVTIDKPEISVVMKPDVAQLSEVVVVGYGDTDKALQGRVPGIRVRGIGSFKQSAKSVVTSVIENQTTVEIEVETPYSINSTGEKLQVELRKYQIEAVYEYFAIPKIDKDAFLIARVINWDKYNLLEGEANLYFEDAFVGRSILDANALKDTLNISLGRDKNIVIGREKNEQFSKRRAIGSNLLETRGFKIIARNKKAQPIKLTLFDQIPVSVVSDIIVSPIELSKGQLDGKTGKIIWELTIEPQQQKEINFQYEVKYPKKEKVILE